MVAKPAVILALLLNLVRPGKAKVNGRKVRGFWTDTDANVDLRLGRMFGLIGIVLGAVIGIIVLAALLVPFFGAVADLNENISNDSITTGDSTADSILRIFTIVFGILAVVFVVGFVVAFLNQRNR